LRLNVFPVFGRWLLSPGPKTRLVDERKDGFDFLGYHFEASKRWPRSKSLKKFRDTIRAKTKRSSGRSMSIPDHC
jgi:hypothetical protein